jgi:cytidylate kinase
VNSARQLTIAIDGPSGAGKSTVARMVAERLGYRFIESGAMYRAVALLAIESNTSLENIQALTHIASSADIKFEWRGHENRIFVRGRDVTEAIRTPVITDAASRVSVHAAVRKELVSQQQALDGWEAL